jgi:hypothetical protein
MSPEARQRAGPGHFLRTDWTTTAPVPLHPPAFLHTKKGVDLISGSSKAAEIIGNNKNQKLSSVGRRFFGCLQKVSPTLACWSLFALFSSRIWRIWSVKMFFFKFK